MRILRREWPPNARNIEFCRVPSAIPWISVHKRAHIKVELTELELVAAVKVRFDGIARQRVDAGIPIANIPVCISEGVVKPALTPKFVIAGQREVAIELRACCQRQS